MNNRYILWLIGFVLFLSIVFVAFGSWKFLLGSAERSRVVKVGFLELPDIDIDRYNKLVKKGL